LSPNRKKLELDVEAKKQQIEKYSLQQFQTKKNDEYRALAHEIETCKGIIVKLEDQQLELMEKSRGRRRRMSCLATQASNEAKKLVEGQVRRFGNARAEFEKELVELESNREQLLMAVDENARSRYERLLKNKGGNVVVGVEHGVCGGCHMKLPAQVVVSCRAQAGNCHLHQLPVES